MRILFVGDVVGRPGRRFLGPALRHLKRKHRAEVVIVNGENAAGGHGLTPSTAKELLRSGADVVTTGNHIWDRGEIRPYLDEQPRILRPDNFTGSEPGSGCFVGEHEGRPFVVINLLGRVFMSPVRDPFGAAERRLEQLDSRARIVVVDFHAEATSEKIALSWHLDGRVSAVIGTHTHVATADARVLPLGTACITDVGMTGAHDSVLGVEKAEVLERFLHGRRIPFTTADGDVRLCGAMLDVDDSSGRSRSIERVELAEIDLGGGA